MEAKIKRILLDNGAYCRLLPLELFDDPPGWGVLVAHKGEKRLRNILFQRICSNLHTENSTCHNPMHKNPRYIILKIGFILISFNHVATFFVITH
jgi:hypothetical protein